MSVWITNTAYNTDSALENRPLIFWHSVVTVSDLSASASQDGYPASNAWSPDTYTAWRGTSASDYLTLANPGAQNVDYIAMVGHNMRSGKISYSISAANNADFSDEIELIGLGGVDTDSPNVEYFDPVNYLFFRINFHQDFVDSAAPIMGHVRMGRATLLQRNIFVDHAPGYLVPKSVKQPQISQSGQFLGTVITRTYHVDEIQQNNNTQAFIRDVVMPFARHANGTRADNGTAPSTFLFAWRPTTYPDEVIYGWTHDDIEPVNAGSNGYMKWSCKIEGQC